jgi:hypothetical protein
MRCETTSVPAFDGRRVADYSIKALPRQAARSVSFANISCCPALVGVGTAEACCSAKPTDLIELELSVVDV